MDPTHDFLSARTSDFSRETTLSQKLRRITEYVAGLQAERRKIEAFKRELPLCLDLLDVAVERFGEELKKCREAVDCRVGKVEGLKPENEDMRSSMICLQLWNHADDDSCDLHSPSHSKSVIQKENGVPVEGGPNMSSKGEVDELSATPLALTPVVELVQVCTEKVRSSTSSEKRLDEELKMKRAFQTQYHQTCRKQKRCWSPELHRKFVDALGQLGGSEVATPKQIRDIMKVEGLTNDEVKSHLQKYRLHVRKAPSPMSGTSSGLTMSQDDQLSRHLNSISPQVPFDRSVGSAKGTSNYSKEDKAEAGTEGHSWQDRVIIFRPCLPTC